MAASAQAAKDIDAYIAGFAPDVRAVLNETRRTIRAAAPDAVESISYQIPTYKLKGKALIYFAGWKAHVSIYPIPKGTAAFRRKLAPYLSGKGTVKFMLAEPIPYDLIAEIARFRMAELAGG